MYKAPICGQICVRFKKKKRNEILKIEKTNLPILLDINGHSPRGIDLFHYQKGKTPAL